MKSSPSWLSFAIPTLIIAAGIYWYVSAGTGNEPALTAGEAQTPTQTHFQALVGELSPISFDTGIFDDPRFMALTNLATPVTPESAGRLDPFAALGGR